MLPNSVMLWTIKLFFKIIFKQYLNGLLATNHCRAPPPPSRAARRQPTIDGSCRKTWGPPDNPALYGRYRTRHVGGNPC